MIKPSQVPRAIIFDIWEAGGSEATVEPNSQGASVRPPAAAGLFYAGDPHRLQTSVAELIGAVEASAGNPCEAGDGRCRVGPKPTPTCGNNPARALCSSARA